MENISSAVSKESELKYLLFYGADDIGVLPVKHGDDINNDASKVTFVKAPGFKFKRKLLVLDLNGLLADILSPVPKEKKGVIVIARRAIYRRPFCLEFLKFCFERFDVGDWSSRKKKNMDKVEDFLMGDMKEKSCFCWDLSKCTATSFRTLENRNKVLVFKELRKIWEKDDTNLSGEMKTYNETNTLLVDDSPYKALLNPPHTAIFPKPYKFLNRSDNSLASDGDLRIYLDGLVMSENTQKYVEEHPFGLSAINERSQSWGFYSAVLSSFSTSQTQYNVVSNSTAFTLCMIAK